MPRGEWMERRKSSPSVLCPEVIYWEIYQIKKKKGLCFPDIKSGYFNEEVDSEPVMSAFRVRL